MIQMSKKILEMVHVTKKFPGVTALRDVNLDLDRGEILGICGENGAGKSTLMKVLSGSYHYGEYEGTIRIEGEEKHFSQVSDAQNSGIEMVYQEQNMMLDASVAENLFVGNLPGKYGMVDYKALYESTGKILEEIHLDVNPKMKVRFMNSGQMQMLSLMRSCIKNPGILVLDEPTTALTDSEVDILMGILDKIRKSGRSCIYISHKLDEIYRICDRVLVMRDGQTISCRPIKEIKQEILIEEMVGRKVQNLYPKQEAEIGEVVLKVEHLTVPHPTIKGKNIIEDISFDLKKGEILGIGGLVGSGRSEILEAVFGKIRAGVTKEITIEGKKAEIKDPGDAIRAGIGFITEERKTNGIIWMLNIRENMVLPSLNELPGRIFVDKAEEKKRVRKFYEALRIKATSMETKIVALSGGNQQKVILGKWLMKNPKILFIDEPTKGIDVGTKADFYQIMCELAKQGVSIVMVSSDMPELVSMSDRCLVISNGRITGELAREEINEKNVMRAAIMK